MNGVEVIIQADETQNHSGCKERTLDIHNHEYKILLFKKAVRYKERAHNISSSILLIKDGEISFTGMSSLVRVSLRY